MFISNADYLDYASVYGGSSYSSLESSGNSAYIGMQSMIWGVVISLFSWLGSFPIYGFGELIEKVTEIANNTRNMDSVIETEEQEFVEL